MEPTTAAEIFEANRIRKAKFFPEHKQIVPLASKNEQHMRDEIEMLRAKVARLEALVSNNPILSASGGVSVRAIAKACAIYFEIPLEEFLGHKRIQGSVQARHVGYYLARCLTDKSLPIIGHAMGGRDHTTILHGFRKVEEQLKTDEDLVRAVETIRAMVLSSPQEEANANS